LRVVGEKGKEHIPALVQNFFAESIAADQMNLIRRGSLRGIGHNPQKLRIPYNSPGFVMEHRHIENISGVQQGQMFQTYQAEHEGPS